MGMRKYNQKIDFTRTAVHLRGNDGVVGARLDAIKNLAHTSASIF